VADEIKTKQKDIKAVLKDKKEYIDKEHAGILQVQT
jgi:hypothetical protein